MLDRAIDRLTAAACNALWRQWAAIGAPAHADESAQAVVDPEALILLSLALHDVDYRLGDMLAWCAAHRSDLISVQRLKTLLRAYPSATETRLSGFAQLAYDVGKDHRWQPFAKDNAPSALTSRERKQAAPAKPLRQGASLMLRLRLAFGIGPKTDILTVMIVAEEGKTVRELTDATNYSRQAVRRGADDLVEAGLLTTGKNAAKTYFMDGAVWREVVDIDDEVRGWIHFHPMYAFIANLIEFHGQSKDLKPYPLSSKLRDIVDKHTQAFTLNDLVLSDFEVYLGTDFLNVAEEIFHQVEDWLTHHA